MKVSFPIFISNGGMISVNQELSEKEIELIKVAEKEEKPLWVIKELEQLVNKIAEDAFDEMANGVYEDDDFIDRYLDGKYDFDKAREYIRRNYFIEIGYPEI